MRAIEMLRKQQLVQAARNVVLGTKFKTSRTQL